MMQRASNMANKTLLLGMLCFIGSAVALDDTTHTNLRQRQLPGGYESMNLGDMNMEEMTFAAGFLCAILLLCCLLCMCCGGGSRCSLWDCVALVCLWEMCCGGRDPRDFVAM